MYHCFTYLYEGNGMKQKCIFTTNNGCVFIDINGQRKVIYINEMIILYTKNPYGNTAGCSFHQVLPLSRVFIKYYCIYTWFIYHLGCPRDIIVQIYNLLKDMDYIPQIKPILIKYRKL